MSKKKVIIIGANFAGLSAAGQFSTAAREAGAEVDVTIIDRSFDFEWTPNIHEIISGVKSRQQLHLSRTDIIGRLGHQFLMDQVIALDPENQQLTLKHRGDLSFDVCLIACGHTSRYLGIAGANQHALPFRSSEHVCRISDAIHSAFALNQPLAVAIVGGGFTGIEALGELLRQYANHHVSISVIEPTQRLLNGLPEVVADDVMSLATAQQVTFHLGKGISGVDSHGVELEDGSLVNADLVIWTAGTELPEFVRNTSLFRQRESGFGCDNSSDTQASGIPVNMHLQSPHCPSIFVAGDAAQPSPGNVKSLTSLKKQAHHALDMGTIAGKNMLRWLIGEPMQTYVPFEKPIVLAFGDLNTYLVLEKTVIASPLLATTKEMVYQLYMAQLSANLPLTEISLGVASRFMGSVQNMLLPSLSTLKLVALLKHSRLLQRGNLADIEMMAKAMLGMAGLSHNRV